MRQRLTGESFWDMPENRFKARLCRSSEKCGRLVVCRPNPALPQQLWQCRCSDPAHCDPGQIYLEEDVNGFEWVDTQAIRSNRRPFWGRGWSTSATAGRLPASVSSAGDRRLGAQPSHTSSPPQTAARAASGCRVAASNLSESRALSMALTDIIITRACTQHERQDCGSK